MKGARELAKTRGGRRHANRGGRLYTCSRGLLSLAVSLSLRVAVRRSLWGKLLIRYHNDERALWSKRGLFRLSQIRACHSPRGDFTENSVIAAVLFELLSAMIAPRYLNLSSPDGSPKHKLILWLNRKIMKRITCRAAIIESFWNIKIKNERLYKANLLLNISQWLEHTFLSRKDLFLFNCPDHFDVISLRVWRKTIWCNNEERRRIDGEISKELAVVFIHEAFVSCGLIQAAIINGKLLAENSYIYLASKKKNDILCSTVRYQLCWFFLIF